MLAPGASCHMIGADHTVDEYRPRTSRRDDDGCWSWLVSSPVLVDEATSE